MLSLATHGSRERDQADKNAPAKRNAILDSMTLGGIQASWVEIGIERFSRNRIL